MRFPAALGVSLLFTLSAAAATQGGAIPVKLPLFPNNNWWNIDISHAPVDVNSSAYINHIGGNTGMHPDFGGDAGGGDVYGFPFIIVDGTQPKLTVDFVDFGDQSDGVDHNNGDTPFPFYPVPSEAITMNGWVEGGQPGNVDQRGDDRHVLIVDKTNNHLYELYNVWYNGTNWEAGSGAFFDMNTNNRRPDTWTSADAAGLAILPGLVRYDEFSGADEIRHAFRMTVNDSNGYVFPASHDAGNTVNALPMGARLRLNPLKDISSYPANVQKIFRAFKKYGLIVADNGTNMYVSGTYDTQWDNDVLNPAFASLKASDFEVIQLGWQPTVTFLVSFPTAVGAGDATSMTITAYDSNYNVATGYTGTIHFTSTDGSATLPVNYTFTGADAGSHTFTNGITLRTAGSQSITIADVVTVTNTTTIGVTVGPPMPANFSATATSTTQVNLSWSASTGATQYEIQRTSAGSPYATLNTTSMTSYSDTTATAGATFIYKVRALDASSRASNYTAPDAATTVFFTNDPVVANSTVIKAVHITELRTAVNAMRAVADMSAFSFTDTSLSGVVVKATHIAQLRTALSAARAALGLSTLTYTDAALSSAVKMKAVHVQELRSGVK